MNKKNLSFLLAISLSLLLQWPANIAAQGRKPAAPTVKVEYSSWLNYRGHEKSTDALRRHQSELEHVSLFAVHFDQSFNLIPADFWVANTLEQLKTYSKSQTTPFYLTAVNDVASAGKIQLKDPASVHAVLSSPAMMTKHIDNLLELSESLQGVEIDYENLSFKDRDLFSTFIQELASRLHERDQQLIVMVQAKTYESGKDGAGAIDWSEIGKYADMVKIMAYYSNIERREPGPVSPPNWIFDLSNFAHTQIPPEKICIALSMDGCDWPNSGQGKSISYDAANRLASVTGAKVERDDKTQSPHFVYEMNGKHEVWFEDAVSIQKKIGVLRHTGVQHVALWWLGSGEDAVWNRLAVASK